MVGVLCPTCGLDMENHICPGLAVLPRTVAVLRGSVMVGKVASSPPCPHCGFTARSGGGHNKGGHDEVAFRCTWLQYERHCGAPQTFVGPTLVDYAAWVDRTDPDYWGKRPPRVAVPTAPSAYAASVKLVSCAACGSHVSAGSVSGSGVCASCVMGAVAPPPVVVVPPPTSAKAAFRKATKAKV